MINLKFNIMKGEECKLNAPLFDLQGNTISIFEETALCLEEQLPTILTVITTTDDIVGGIFLTKRQVAQTQEEIRRLLPVEGGYIWECSTLYFTHSQQLTSDSSAWGYFLRHFFHTLYEGLVSFAKQTGIGFVIIKLTADTYLPTQDIGLWPYIVEFLPKESTDHFFYGILPLKGQFCKNYQEMWEG